MPVAEPVPRSAGPLQVGLIDSGVDDAHPTLRHAEILRHGCADGAHPAPHGTAVASLMVGAGDRFTSALPRATLYAGDAYCDAATGGSVEAIARELAWMARMRVAVVNISLVGPSNQVLQRVIEHAVARGMLIVAAVGNDGPAAPPLYPASWPGVVGVGAVDGKLRLLPEGARGPQVMFVAPGAGHGGRGGQRHAARSCRCAAPRSPRPSSPACWRPATSRPRPRARARRSRVSRPARATCRRRRARASAADSWPRA